MVLSPEYYDDFGLEAEPDILPDLNLIPNPFKLPSSTPAVVPYPNLIGSTQHARNNFKPRKRQFKRVASAQENDAALRKVLKDYWGHDDFRGPQLDVCRSVMGGWDVMVVAPTGLGKSVCFQVPAVALEYGITLVVSPLLALMKDQVSSLQAKGIKAAMLYEKSPQKDCLYIKKQLQMGHPELRLLYLTPETLFSLRISYELGIAYQQKQIRRLVVDEAHVIEEWGMTFRASYRDLGKFRINYPNIPVTALTASATEDVRADILTLLGIQKKDLAQWVEPFNRKNLFYEIRYRGGLDGKEKTENIAQFINTYRIEARKRNKENGVPTDSVSGLVYCRSRGTCEDVAELLRARNIAAQPFHAKLSDQRRNQLLDAWKHGRVECIVATIAFGMGVDQAHVRYVVHYDMPKSFEGYYQETGRAGRDGHASRCILYYSREDAKSLRYLLETEAERIAAAKKKQEQGNGPTQLNQAGSELDKAKVRCMNSFKILQHYAEADTVCRHIAICRYFGERIDANDPELQRAYCAGMCDVCANPGAVKRRATTVSENLPVASQVVRRKALSTIHSVSIPSSDNPEPPIPSSLRLLHGSDIPDLSSDPPLEVRVIDELPISPGKGSSKPLEMPVGSSRDEVNLVEKSSSASTSGAIFGSARSRLRSDMDHAESSDQENRVPPVEPNIHASSSKRPKASASRPSPQPASSLRLTKRVPESTRPYRQSRYTGPTLASPTLSTLDTPCPPPGIAGYGRASSRAGPSRPKTTDLFTEGYGEYAQADPLPVDPEKRERQRDAFRAVTPVTGRGPYSYYTNTAPPTATTVRKRRLSAAQEVGMGFRTPFKTPFIKERSKHRAGTISESARVEAIEAIRDGLRKSLLDDKDELWAMWGKDHTSDKGKKSLIRSAAVELESVIVRECATPDMLRNSTEQLVQAIRILRTREGRDIILERKLAEYKMTAHGKMLILLDGVMRELG